jgi:hypothetical protein
VRILAIATTGSTEGGCTFRLKAARDCDDPDRGGVAGNVGLPHGVVGSNCANTQELGYLNESMT